LNVVLPLNVTAPLADVLSASTQIGAPFLARTAVPVAETVTASMPITREMPAVTLECAETVTAGLPSRAATLAETSAPELWLARNVDRATSTRLSSLPPSTLAAAMAAASTAF
jgi:hypothetical protein